MYSETEGKLTLGLIPTSKGWTDYWTNLERASLNTGLPRERTADLKLTLKRCSEETALYWDEKKTTSGVDSLPKMLDLICMIIYNVFFF